jgi:hypothetical protein
MGNGVRFDCGGGVFAKGAVVGGRSGWSTVLGR